jgi:hypothetical protein
VNALYPVESVEVVTAKLLSVAVLVKLNAILRLFEVLIVFPPLYALCNVMVSAEHFVTLFEASTQRTVPAVPGVVKPVNLKNESASVLTVTLFVESGEKVETPFAVKV